MIQRATSPKVSRWRRYQNEILFSALLLDFLGFFWARQKPEAFDAVTYFQEASKLRTHGFIPSFGPSWLESSHNYLYPTFIFLLKYIGVTTRSGITIIQFVLIVSSCVFLSLRLSKVLKCPIRQLLGITLLLAFFPILAFSGYLLTEALASSLLILWITLFLELALKKFSPDRRSTQILCISLLAGSLWMVRPAFTWIPLANLMCILLLEYERHTSRISLVKNSLESTFILLVGTSLPIIPQYLITKSTTSMLNGVFHLDQWQWMRTMDNSIFRYVTNVSGCGPNPLIFSPYSQTYEGIYPPHFNTSPVSRITGFVSRLASGWDAVPSPLTYVYHLSVFPWIFLTAISGFLICAPFFLLMPSRIGPTPDTKRFRGAELGIVIIFMVSQLAAGMTHGEFRYNAAGWIIAGFSILLLPQHFKDGFPWKRFVAISLSVSFFVIVVGQLTLSLSQFWLACVK